ncbi:transcription initiation factor TFIID subunit 3 isoform X1 [Dasypus novemcinctus]|uniref:transcription initiation factor TFIID subunit 3 isoform X1 n=1 Tax=Dasypus novemcinctus TaxID=9361 RepID=UPI00265E966C|nr:transcription initiation factor TFIID subunit 3 isoform X1 [Dasypus novemcinctus]
MCESYSRSLLRVSVAQICQALGWDSVQLSACHLLTDVLQRYLQQLGRGCHRYSELYGRTDPILDDVSEAFQLMGVNLHELEDYIHNIEPVTFPHQIPSFPVSKNNVLQFPQPGSKDAEERKEYIPDYMPPIVSSQEEEEEEEQVPTDGGTSAEAMQVPLEEDDELEEEEIINDENFLGKRPLDSPEAEEMPAMKRPRLLSTKGDTLDVVLLEAREPLSSINTQKIPPMLSPVHVQDNTDLAPPSPEPPMLAPVAKSQMPTAKQLETKSFTPKAKTKTSSPGQKTKSPKTTQSPVMAGSPIRSPKTTSKEKKSPGRSKSPKSPKSPKVMTHISQAPVRPETPNRTPSATISEKINRETVQVKQIQTPPDAGKLNNENQPKRAVVIDKTIDDSIDAVIARACAEREPDPFEFSSGSESEGDIFTSPKRISGSECTTPKASTSSNNFTKSGSTPLPLSGGTSSSDNSWTMDASIDEVVRKAKLGAPSAMPPNFPYFSSPSVSPPTPELLHKVYEEKTKLPSSVEVKKKLKKELKTKMKKKEKQRDKEREKDKSKEKNKEKDKVKEKEKEISKETKYPWKEFLKDEDSDPYKFKIKEFEDVDPKVRLKDGMLRKEKEKHKDKKKDREKGKKDKEKREKEKAKDKGKEEKMKALPAPVVLPPKELALPLFSPAAAVRIPSMLPSLSPMLPEKLFEEKEKPKEKDRKKDKKEKKKKKEKEKEKKEKEREKEKREREKREKEKEKHKHEKIKVEPVVPAPSPVIPRLTLRVGAGQDKIVISKVVPAPEAKPAPSLNRPKSPPPAPAPAPAPPHLPPAPPAPPPAPPAPAPALPPAPAPAPSGSAKAPVRSVVTETVSTYVIRDEWGNQIWICPGCNKPDDGSPMIGCDDCDDWYHWPCVGIMAAPPEEMQWFCPKCANKKKDKKHKKRKHRAH